MPELTVEELIADYDPEKFEVVEADIGHANLYYAMLAYEGGDMKIMQPIAGDARRQRIRR